MKDAFDRIMAGEDIETVTNEEVALREFKGKALAEKFPELKGLSWIEFMGKLPIPLDFIIAHEMWEALK